MKLTRAPLAVGVGLLVLGGCDYPTEVPQIEQRWILAVESTSFGVDELLPTGVTVQGANFSMSVDPFSTTQTLASVCASCPNSGGIPLPYPGFDAQFSVDQALPADVTGATLAGGTVQVSIQNGFSFDPIRLPSGATGTLTVTVTDGPGGATLGEVVVDGATESLPGGSTLTKTITLARASVGNTVTAVVDISSPAGSSPTDDTATDPSESLTVTATPSSILISSAMVSVAGETVEFDPQDVDTEDMDDAFTDRIQQGAIILDVTNPFGVSVSGSLVLGSVTKALNIPASGTSQVTISYTGDELRAILGQAGVQFSGGGTVSATGPVEVTPGQEVTLAAKLDFTLIVD